MESFRALKLSDWENFRVMKYSNLAISGNLNIFYILYFYYNEYIARIRIFDTIHIKAKYILRDKPNATYSNNVTGAVPQPFYAVF